MKCLDTWKNINISSLNTKNMRDMRGIFESCKSLREINVSHFDVANVRDLSSMFNGCSSLISLDLSNFNTSSIQDMDCMFYKCPSLIYIDISSFSTTLDRIDILNYYSSRNGTIKINKDFLKKLPRIPLQNWNLIVVD